MGPELWLLQQRLHVVGAMEAPKLVSLQRFGLSLALLSPLSFSFIFLPGSKPSAVTATIVCLQGPEQHSNEVPDLISALQRLVGQ